MMTLVMGGGRGGEGAWLVLGLRMATLHHTRTDTTPLQALSPPPLSVDLRGVPWSRSGVLD
jgi:hypothetical protein